ncbi:DEAD/DEAH box helicase family protein [Agromyces allii]|uniref:DEAD/DEAH box helicase family protein n=1 Tax=Agromyces allii TaxID=393607 RepID=A0ABP5BHA6_9MICO|nr:DEAD/DEAH box helicase family protein [Agromyces allii]
MGNFDFVAPDWPEIASEAARAEFYTYGDPRSSLFYARRTVELSVYWLYRADASLKRPYKDDLSSLLHEPTFKRLVGDAVLTKMNLIRKRGNDAVHKTYALTNQDSLAIVRELFHTLHWLATRYASTPEHRPMRGKPFDAASIPKPQPGLISKTKAELAKALDENAVKDAALAAKEAESEQLRAENAALKAQVALVKAANAAVPDTHDYNEAETRDQFIDQLLREAGWDPRDEHAIEFEVGDLEGTPSGVGRVDYVLWGDDGRPLGLIEAKRTKRDPRSGQQQAKLYADALERRFGMRPVIFTSNGYEHWIWDDAPAGTGHPPREVQGFYTKDELTRLQQRRQPGVRHPLASIDIDAQIVERTYQHQAIRAVTEAFERDRERHALLVMATGSGKTRTVIGLVDLLTRANHVKTVLFLADRKALVTQAANAFKEHLPGSPTVNLLDARDVEGRVYVSTYPTMLGLLNRGGDTAGDGTAELRRFGPGFFDLIVIDEAHRSVYQKYGAIFDYFDAPLVGLTATPKDEVDHNTYRLFRLEDGVPTFSYELGTAIDEGYLVPPVAHRIESKFVRSGIRYDDLTDEQKEDWDLTEWGEDGVIPDRIEAESVNRWLFNEDTVDRVLGILMTEGRTVAAGDRLGKTIVFAKNIDHARFIQQRFDENYPEYAGHFAQVIVSSDDRAQNLIEQFGRPDAAPHIAISVDMLDTGIDVPEIVNLVFFKAVFSKSKYWQMIGRGTRLRRDIYGPGEDKRDFIVFDVGGNIEYFNQDVPEAAGSSARSLHGRLFDARLALITEIDRADVGGGAGTFVGTADRELRTGLAERLQRVVAEMSEHNVLVRPHRRLVERFARGDAWQGDAAALAEASALAELPSAALVADTDERAKRFDLLVLRAQLGVLTADAGFAQARDRIRALASALGEQRSIPAVAKHLDLIDAVAGEEWWQDVTLPLLELVRTRLRELVKLIDVSRQAPVYTDFDDEVRSEAGEFVFAAPGVDSARFRAKLYAYLVAHENHVVLRKLRTGKQLTATDVEELERMLREGGEFGASDLADLDAAAAAAKGLGRFIRSIVGLERSAAQEALAEFVSHQRLGARQISFVDLIVDRLAHDGSVPIDALYEDQRYRRIAETGPEELFGDSGVDELVAVLRSIEIAADPVESLRSA